MATTKSSDAQDKSVQKQQSNANVAKSVKTDAQKEPTVRAQEDAAVTQDEAQVSQAPASVTSDEVPTAEEEARVLLESELERQGQSGNPYLHSSDGNGRPYNPEIDGKPGKEAERKQAEHDNPKV